MEMNVYENVTCLKVNMKSLGDECSSWECYISQSNTYLRVIIENIEWDECLCECYIHKHLSYSEYLALLLFEPM
jgi:hypothetical protein